MFREYILHHPVNYTDTDSIIYTAMQLLVISVSGTFKQCLKLYYLLFI